VSDSTNLPVAPEFAETLGETAVETLLEYLKDTNAPDSIIQLTNNIEALGYYLSECYRSPEQFQREPKDRLDIEMITVETINLIAACGGVFRGPNGQTQPRNMPTPVKVRKG
jgi:hypothetical protein